MDVMGWLLVAWHEQLHAEELACCQNPQTNDSQSNFDRHTDER
jgi:hypothetical protein